MKITNFAFLIFLIVNYPNLAIANNSFDEWKSSFKKFALNQGISSKTLNEHIDKSKFLPDVIKYDRYQPEFYEDTKTYISKRTSTKKIKIGNNIYKKNIDKINIISKKYNVDKDLLLSLLGC